ncbi:MAG: flagellar protein FlgN [Planctomycetes bacterium]|nr:flagellar protein FlgN [Planctomycetota bacterium]
MDNSTEQLIIAMQQEVEAHEELAQLLENKLDAMKHYDLSRLEALSTGEQQVVSELGRKGQLRQAAVHKLAREFYPQSPVKHVTARQLAKTAGEPLRSKLLALAGILREVAEKVKRLNEINAQTTGKVMVHFDAIFKLVAQFGCDIGLYGRAGKQLVFEQRRIIDAIA